MITALHSAESLARMGDLAQRVAEAVRRRYPAPVLPEVLRPRFATMGEIAVDLATPDIALARAATAADGELDDLHRSLFAVLDYPDWAHGVAAAVDASQLSQCYERFGDHAVTITHRAVFVRTGTLTREAS